MPVIHELARPWKECDGDKLTFADTRDNSAAHKNNLHDAVCSFNRSFI